jgi:hypothetical protein
VSAADVFAILWSTLVDLLGSAAAATLLRRAARKARARAPELEQLQVVRERWGYRYSAPAGWESQNVRETPALAELVVSELCPILHDLTGPLVLRRLEAVPELEELLVTRSER